MNYNKTNFLENFFVVGVNYKNTDAITRGRFAISNDQYKNILLLAPSFEIDELFVLSTCNRTEIYALAKSATHLIELLCTQTGDMELFSTIAYVRNGMNAISHLYEVGSGLDSQILGDYEIVSQLKQAFKFSREHNFIGSFSDRLVNSVLQSSKKIKTNTALSSGTVSVSFSAVKYIKEKTNFNTNNKILVIGAGKIGRNSSKNLVNYFGNKNITVINRSEDKALQLAAELGIQRAPIDDLIKEVNIADVIIVATNAHEPILSKLHFEGKGHKVIIDLSIPCNVSADVDQLPNITLIHVDQISKIKDDNLKKRELEIPKAQEIISEHMQEFIEWHEMRKNVPVLKVIKTKLKEIYTLPLFFNVSATNNFAITDNSDEKIQLIIKSMANKMRTSRQRGCHCIEAMNEFILEVAN